MLYSFLMELCQKQFTIGIGGKKESSEKEVRRTKMQQYIFFVIKLEKD